MKVINRQVTEYQCEICNEKYDDVQVASECEAAHSPFAVGNRCIWWTGSPIDYRVKKVGIVVATKKDYCLVELASGEREWVLVNGNASLFVIKS